MGFTPGGAPHLGLDHPTMERSIFEARLPRAALDGGQHEHRRSCEGVGRLRQDDRYYEVISLHARFPEARDRVYIGAALNMLRYIRHSPQVGVPTARA
jgi:hypothetical protein